MNFRRKIFTWQQHKGKQVTDLAASNASGKHKLTFAFLENLPSPKKSYSFFKHIAPTGFLI
jgi:hypothetical protein